MIDQIFWLSLILLAYINGGYLLILWMWVHLGARNARMSGSFSPKVTVLITAFNEEACIGQALRSILESDYPKDDFKVVVVSDASTDRTDEIVGRYEPQRVKLLRMRSRGGKVFAQRMALPYANGEILIIADASGLFMPDTIRKLTRHFRDPRVGLVVGRKRIQPTGTVVAEGDGVYWRYDALLRYLESQTGSSCVGAEGGLTAIRRHLFPINIPSDIAEDYAMGCELFKRGYQSRYDPTATIFETPSDGIEAEFKRKVRVIVKGMRTFVRYRSLLNPLKSFSYPFQTVSHKLLRWFGPFLLIALLVSSAFSDGRLERSVFHLQVAFYGLALLGFVSKRFKMKLTSVPLYFTTVNLAALVAWGLVFKKYGVWEPTRREQPAA